MISSVPVVPVKLKANGRELMTYAMLDTCSTATFILNDVKDKLGVPGTTTKLMIKTVNGSTLHESSVVNNITISSLDDQESIQLPKVYTRYEIPSVAKEELPTPELARKWKHLEGIADKIHHPTQDPVVGILVGAKLSKGH